MLNSAHEGYEYQDFISVYFILESIINEEESIFKIDQKEDVNDKFDDLAIISPAGYQKKQIKYSNSNTAHILEKSDISTVDPYGIPIDYLFNTWKSLKNKNDLELRLCLAWDKPVDEINDVLNEVNHVEMSFREKITNLFQIDINKLWPMGQKPLKNWRRFNTQSIEIDRNEFASFCDNLVIEVGYPKFSLDIRNPGALEEILLNQATRIGIGTFPNQDIAKEDFILRLAHIVKRARSTNQELNTKDIIYQLEIKTDYGSIEQIFPVDPDKNISLSEHVDLLLEKASTVKKILVTGEPGSGKSWLVNNIVEKLIHRNISVVKHYCYTDLNDEYSIERIKTNIFYGNLIKDILIAHPQLKKEKNQLYASSLGEVNQLIAMIDKPTIFIIDGLDHIDRISALVRNVSLDEVDIIKQINNIEVNEFVSILVFSQPIDEVYTLLKGFCNIKIPNWTQIEVLGLLKKLKINDVDIDNNNLSEILLEKSNGNPLYLNYLIEEIKSILHPDQILKQLNTLPEYDVNLQSYYNHLLIKLEKDTNIPQVLSLVNFNLTEVELEKITGQGKKVNKAIKLLFPILRHNVSTSGYIIYHESFRRFIFNYFIAEQININMVYKLIFDWFENEGFFKYSKAYRHYLPLLFNAREFQKIYQFINRDFIYESVYFGNQWDLIIKNYYVMVKSIPESGNLKSMLVLNEIKKVLTSTDRIYDDSFIAYFEALGLLFGFDKVASTLTYEGNPTLPLDKGLQICYLCDDYKAVAPWGCYYNGFEQSNMEVTPTNFRYFLRYYLVSSDVQKIYQIANNLYSNYQFSDWVEEFCGELKRYHRTNFVNGLTANNAVILQMYHYSKTQIATVNLMDLTDQILSFENVVEKEICILEEFFLQIKSQIEDDDLINKIISLLSSKNWFYSWVVFNIRIIQIKSKKYPLSKLIDVFFMLKIDVKNKPKPRAIDLYQLRNAIYNSILSGLQTCVDDKTFIEVIKILLDVRKVSGGNFATSALFTMLSSIENKVYLTSLTLLLEEEFDNIKQDEYYYVDLADVCFILSKQFSLIGKTDKSQYYYTFGIRFLFGYTWRRDLAIEDVFDSFEAFNFADSELGHEYIKKLKNLVDAIDTHTDGKDTKYFQMEWFERFFNINEHESLLYLRAQLLSTRYNWRLEESLKFVTMNLKGKISPLILTIINQTFILESSEELLLNYIELTDEIKDVYPLNVNLALIYSRYQIERDNDFSVSFKNKISGLLEITIPPLPLIANVRNKEQSPYRHSFTQISEFIKHRNNLFEIRNCLSDLSLIDICNYFKNNETRIIHIQSLIYLFDNLEAVEDEFGQLILLTGEVKSLIRCLVGEYDISSKRTSSDELDIVFTKHQEIYEYYLMAKFVYSKDGWLRNLVDVDSFIKAFNLNTGRSNLYLLELIPTKLSLTYYNRSMSASLINSISKIDKKSNFIVDGWLSLYEFIESRFPLVPQFDWNLALSNNLEMDIEEVCICIILTRFKLCTVHRVQLLLSAITYLINYFPDKLVKPLKWLFANVNAFESSIIVCILEIIHEYCKIHADYKSQIRPDLLLIYPTKYFLMDFIIEDLYNLPKQHFVFVSNPPIYSPVDNDLLEYFLSGNDRYRILNRNGFDMEYIVSKFIVQKEMENRDSLDFFYDRLYKTFVNHIFSSDLLLKLVNTEYYSDFKFRADQAEIYESIKIDTQSLIAQTISLAVRPIDLPLNNLSKDNLSRYAGFVRLAHYEIEQVETRARSYERSKIKTFGGVVFSTKGVELFPFSGYKLNTKNLWKNSITHYPLEETIIFTNISSEKCQLELFKILWLNPEIINKLDLHIGEYTKGLYATDKQGNIILKFNCWSTGYYASEGYDNIAHETPQYDGSELMIREDYFHKICGLYSSSPEYCVIQI